MTGTRIGSDVQLGRLAQVLMDEFGGPDRPESAVDMAIRLLREQRVEILEARDVIVDMAMQFSLEGEKDGLPTVHTAGLSTLEDAFDYLGWDDPHVIGNDR